MGYCHRFPDGIPLPEADIHVFLTRPPLPLSLRRKNVRLACVRHAASVYPEPGSNSPSSCIITSSLSATKHNARKTRPGRGMLMLSVIPGWFADVCDPPTCPMLAHQQQRASPQIDRNCCVYTVAASLFAGEKPVAVLHSTLQLLRFFTLKCLAIPFYRLLQ